MAADDHLCGAGPEHGRWTGTGAVLPGADPAGPAAILIAVPGGTVAEGAGVAGTGVGGETALATWLARLPAGHAFRVLLSPPAAGLLHLAAINAGLQAVCLPVGKLRELQRVVGARTEALITVDAHRHTVTADKEFSTVLAPAEFISIRAAGSVPAPARPADGQRPGDYAQGAAPAGAGATEPVPLADRIRTAQLRILSLEVPSDVRIQLQRRLIAVCDAAKAPGADPARCGQRLAALLAELDPPNAPPRWLI